RTIAGRVQMAEQLLQMNLIKNPQQYFQVMNTGRLDTMFEGEQNELLLIKAENERLMDGQDVQASALDSHRMHIMEHKSVLADPDLRKDNSLVEKVMAHITQHIDLLRNTDPDLLALVGEQPLPPLQQPMAPTPTGESIPVQNQQVPARAAERSPMQDIMSQQGAAPEVISNAQGQGQALPSMPRPPAPFQNMPVSPEEMLPG
ncbi:hypothetical protein EB118_26115, partial [bacterium]|nr:hypothetical protein [bacterium]